MTIRQTRCSRCQGSGRFLDGWCDGCQGKGMLAWDEEGNLVKPMEAVRWKNPGVLRESPTRMPDQYVPYGKRRAEW